MRCVSAARYSLAVKQEAPYNPLEKRHLAESMANALLHRPIEPLPPPEVFEGAGIYAIYYTGTLDVYELISRHNRDGLYEMPIYIGKADPQGGRKGADFDAPHGLALWSRLADHAKSVSAATNLSISDFACRHLVVDEVWIRMAERMLISWHQPVWNMVVDGFGNHDPGGRRATQYRSPWDSLHPGRPWAVKLADSGVHVDQIRARILDHLGARVAAELEARRTDARAAARTPKQTGR